MCGPGCKCGCPCADKNVPRIEAATNPLARMARNVLAKTNPDLAKSLAAVMKDHLQSSLKDLDVNYDALESGLRGMSSGAFSFPARPVEFEQSKPRINGNILVKVTLDPPVEGSGKDVVGKTTTMSLEAGYYFKTPKLPGKGKYMRPTDDGKWEDGGVPVGSSDVTFGDDGIPEFSDESAFESLIGIVQSLTTSVLDSPPEGAQSQAKEHDPNEARVKREQAEEADRFRAEKDREKSQQKDFDDKQEADSAVYGSPENFKTYMDDQGEAKYGPADLQKILETMFKTKDQRMMARNVIIEKLLELGLKFDPAKRVISSIGPSGLSDALREIAEYIDTNESPSHEVVASRLAALIKSI